MVDIVDYQVTDKGLHSHCTKSQQSYLQAGDFVRWTKQVIDLLDQISQVGEGKTSRTAEQAIEAIRRGVVAYSSVGA